MEVMERKALNFTHKHWFIVTRPMISEMLSPFPFLHSWTSKGRKIIQERKGGEREKQQGRGATRQWREVWGGWRGVVVGGGGECCFSTWETTAFDPNNSGWGGLKRRLISYLETPSTRRTQRNDMTTNTASCTKHRQLSFHVHHKHSNTWISQELIARECARRVKVEVYKEAGGDTEL